MADPKPSRRKYSPPDVQVSIPFWTRQPAKDASSTELADQIRECLADLRKFVSPLASLDAWPSMNALNHLMSLVEALARASGIVKVEPGYFSPIMRRLDARFKPRGLCDFVSSLVAKLESLPKGPVVRIQKELETCNCERRKQQLKKVQALLRSPTRELNVTPGTWRELGPLLIDLSDGHVKSELKIAKPATMQEIGFLEAKQVFEPLSGLAAFLELQNQHFDWQARWARRVLPIVPWIYMLQNPGWDQRLRRAFLLRDIEPAQFKKLVRTGQDRAKKQRSRARAKLARASIDSIV